MKKEHKPGILYLGDKPQELVRLDSLRITIAPEGTTRRYLFRRTTEVLIGLWGNLLWVALLVWIWSWETAKLLFITLGIGLFILVIAWLVIRLAEKRSGYYLK